MRGAVAVAAVVVVCFLVGCVATAARSSVTAACVFAIVLRDGDLVVQYEPATIVGEVEGRDEWWLDLPTRERLRGVDGRPRAWNWPKSEVLRVGEVRQVGTKVCRCPQ